MGNHRRPLVMRDLSERLVSGRKEPRGGGGGGGGEFRFKTYLAQAIPARAWGYAFVPTWYMA